MAWTEPHPTFAQAIYEALYKTKYPNAIPPTLANRQASDIMRRQTYAVLEVVARFMEGR